MKFSTSFTVIMVTLIICLAWIVCTFLRCDAAFEIATSPVHAALTMPDGGGEPERAETWNPKGGL